MCWYLLLQAQIRLLRFASQCSCHSGGILLSTRQSLQRVKRFRRNDTFLRGESITYISLRVISARAIPLLLLLGCEHQAVEPEPPALVPRINAVQIAANPHNVLSAIAEVRVTNAQTVVIEFGADSLFQQSTPKVHTNATSTQLAVFGLESSTKYFLRALAISSTGHRATSAVQTFTTSAIPNDFTSFSILTNTLPVNGLVMLSFIVSGAATKSYAQVLTNDGRLAWYREFAQPVVDFQKQPNGNYTAYTSLDASPSRFFEFDNIGHVLREFAASGGRATGSHELRLFDNGYCLFGVEFRPMDLTAIGGWSNASVRGLVVEYYRGNASLQWNTFDYLAVEEGASDMDVNATPVNPWHGNAIDIDRDGHLLVSFRNSVQIVKINAQTGAIIWRLGGKKSQFTFVNDSFNGFSHQHGIRRLANGNIILFDNGNLHSPPTSRAVEYRLDEQAKTATLVWEYRHEPTLYGFALGFAQRLANGNTLICYGIAQRIIEVDAAGNKVWDLKIEEPNRFVYRAFRIESLY